MQKPILYGYIKNDSDKDKILKFCKFEKLPKPEYIKERTSTKHTNETEIIQRMFPNKISVELLKTTKEKTVLFDASKLPKRPLLETINEMEANSLFVCIELIELGDNLLAVLEVLRLCAYKRINLVSIKQGEIQLANNENLLIAIMEIQKNFIQTKE